MKILVCFISNNHENLELSLVSHSSNFTGETRVMILDTQSVHEKNKRLASDYDAIHVCEEEFKASAKDEFKPLFQGAYGGNRNVCLYRAFKEGTHAVFFDDDTTPFENPLAQYASLFAGGRKIIAGKYLRHAAGTPQIIKAVIETACAYADGETQKQEAQEKFYNFFAGVPPETDVPLKGVGVTGGNAGISFGCLSEYCFFPTNYRVEDGTYGVLAKAFAGEEPFNREDNPAVFHNKKPRENALLSNLENELKGNVIALCVKDSIEDEDLGLRKIAGAIERNAETVFKGFNLDYLLYKNSQKNLFHKAKELGFEREFGRLLGFAETSFAPSEQEVKSKAQLFFYAQDNWGKLLRRG